VAQRQYSDCKSANDLREKLSSEGFLIFSWQDGPGAYYSPHSHPHDEYIVVYSGEIVFQIDGEDMLVTTGDALDLPADTVHAAENRGKKPVAYFICTK
jgi:quercetin dioxygenase-like cupin family protein